VSGGLSELCSAVLYTAMYTLHSHKHIQMNSSYTIWSARLGFVYGILCVFACIKLYIGSVCSFVVAVSATDCLRWKTCLRNDLLCVERDIKLY